MKDTIDRAAAVRVLASVPAWGFLLSQWRRPAVQKSREVAHTDETLTKPPAPAGGMLLVNRGNAMLGVRARRSVLPLAEPSRE
jgi:hypothetical protein